MVALVLPHRVDDGIQPLSRILDIGLIRNHDRFALGNRIRAFKTFKSFNRFAPFKPF